MEVVHLCSLMGSVCVCLCGLTSLWEDTLSDDVSEFLQGHIGVLATVLWIVDEEAIPLLAAVPQKTHS